jgi:hypothetical protein
MKNKYPQNFNLLLLSLLILYFASRLYHLANFPMFADEGLHIWRAIKVTQDGPFSEVLRLGKFLTIWMISIFVPLASHHLLWVGRFVSVVFGMLGLIGCYLLGTKLFNHRIGKISAVLYLVVPYTFFYDRMAHVDGALAVLTIYVAYFSLKFVDQPNFKHILVLGISLTLIFLTKLNGLVLGLIPILILITQRFSTLRNFPWLRLGGVYAISILGIIPVLFNFATHWDRAWDRMQLSRLPADTPPLWSTWLSNVQDTVHFLGYNLSWLIFALVCLGIVVALTRHNTYDWLLLGGAGLTLGIFVIAPKAGGWYPRYLLPAVPFLLLIAAQTIDWGLNKLEKKFSSKMWFYAAGAVFFILLILPALRFDYKHLVEPSHTPFVQIDRWQYITGAYAGYGLDEAANYIREQVPPSGQIIVVYDLHPGSIYDVLQAYLYGERDQIIHVILRLAIEDPDEMAQMLAMQSRPVFLVVADSLANELELDTWPYIERVAHFKRPGGETAINIYQGK